MAKDLILFYEPSSDELNIHFGEPRNAIAKEIDDEVFLRLDPETRELVGFTVLHFRARFGQTEAKPFSLVLPVLAQVEMPKTFVEAWAK